jgi:hypothetical protein
MCGGKHIKRYSSENFGKPRGSPEIGSRRRGPKATLGYPTVSPTHPGAREAKWHHLVVCGVWDIGHAKRIFSWRVDVSA